MLFRSPREAHMPTFAPEPAPAFSSPAPVAESASVASHEPEAVIETVVPPPPPREPTEVVITEAEPDRPKKGGWWQRVRTPFGGG